jgi:hypothetical protein
VTVSEWPGTIDAPAGMVDFAPDIRAVKLSSRLVDARVELMDTAA